MLKLISVSVESRDKMLLFEDPPAIINDVTKQCTQCDHPERSQYGWASQNRTFRCLATGRPVPDVVWLRGADDYVTSDEIYYISETRIDETSVSSELQVTQHCFQYRCSRWNDCSPLYLLLSAVMHQAG